ncbi:hypothetical protein E3N88_07251 [Mikania micrantha]|uniref:Uncharacterized protein n=1 Tax=Mikania micrantha TaxID=192012 RepID=A0A5N6PT55_9ASTR|nr:hypothetical protein E3N88_07251 [Mikania micrantha]
MVAPPPLVFSLAIPSLQPPIGDGFWSKSTYLIDDRHGGVDGSGRAAVFGGADGGGDGVWSKSALFSGQNRNNRHHRGEGLKATVFGGADGGDENGGGDKSGGDGMPEVEGDGGGGIRRSQRWLKEHQG